MEYKESRLNHKNLKSLYDYLDNKGLAISGVVSWSNNIGKINNGYMVKVENRVGEYYPVTVDDTDFINKVVLLGCVEIIKGEGQ